MKMGKIHGAILPLLLWGCLSIISSAHAQAPSIVVQPASQSSAVGGTIQFTVSATGSGALIYQWRKNDTNLANGTFPGRATVSGATTAAMTLAGVTTNDQANYTCFITNYFGAITSSVASLAIFVAPVITTQPKSYNTNAGASVTFSVAASGTAPLSYQWYKDGLPLSGAILNAYSLSGLLASDSGTYTVRVSNPAGNATSTNAVLNVGIAPTITGHPASLVAMQGQSATFSVTATGTPLNYFWKKNGTFITGKTNSSLTIASVVSTDAANYTCQVSNFLGTVTSSGATLTFGAPATITAQPVATTVAVGGNASLCASASGTAPLSYQWYHNGLPVSGANQSCLSFNPAALADAGSYYVTAANGFGTNNSVTVLLNVGVAPAITVQPQSITVTQGQSAHFSAAASGGEPLTYSWSRNDAPIEGTTNLDFTITNALPADAGFYAFTATNPYGTASSTNAVLTIYYPPTITVQPTSQTVGVGTYLALSVTADGNPLAYQWRLNGSPILTATNLMYEVPAAQLNNSGNYDVIVSNALGSVTSSVAVATVIYYPPAITAQPSGSYAYGGQSWTFAVTATGSELAYQWLKNGNPLPGANGAQLTLNNLGVNDSGDYSVVVTNQLGRVTSSAANLSVHYIYSQPVGRNVLVGNNLTLNVGAQGDTLAYQWLKNNAIIPSANAASLMLTNVSLTDAGNYTVVVTNYNGGETSSVAAVYVGYAPTITQQPFSATNAFGSTAMFTCTAAGPQPMTYQWFQNSANLTGQTSATLTLTNLQLGNVGNYYVIVGNAFGSITSSVAVLHISPGIVTQPTNQTVMPGAPASFYALAGGEPPLAYQWHLNGPSLADNTNISGSASNYLSLVAAMTNSVGNYTVIVSNSYGAATSSVAILEFGFKAVSVYNFCGYSFPYIVPSGVTQLWVSIVGGNGATADMAGDTAYGGGAGGSASAIIAVFPSSTLLLSVGSSAIGPNGGYCPFTNYNGGSSTTYWGDGYCGGGGAASVVAMPDGGFVVCGGGGGGGGYAGYSNYRPNAGSSIVISFTNSQNTGGSGVGGGGGGGAAAGSAGGYPAGGNGYAPGPDGWQYGCGGAGGSFLPEQYLYPGSQWSFTNSPITGQNGSITIVANPIPFISQQPSSTSAIAGSPAQISIAVASPVRLSYQWFFNGGAIPGMTNSSLPFPAVTPQNTGAYFVVVTNACASVTSSVVTLTVNIPAYFSSQPQDQSVTQGNTATFAAVATGTPWLAYQWFKQLSSVATAAPIIGGGFVLGANVTSGGSAYATPPRVQIIGGGGSGALATATLNNGSVTAINILNPGSGYTTQPTIYIDPPSIALSAQTNATLTITGATTNEAGNYFVVVTNTYGAATSALAKLTVNVPAYITRQPQSVTVPLGGSASFSVSAAGNPPFAYQWYGLTAAQKPAAATALVLNGFVYGATVTSGGAGYSVTPNVQILGGGGSGALAAATLSNGVVVAIEVTNPGSGYTGTPTLQIAPPTPLALPARTNALLTITGVTADDVGSYFVTVANAYGTVTSTQATLVLAAGAAPTITTQPAGRAIMIGAAASLSVTADGTPELRYQWHRNGFALPAATLPVYSISSASTNDSGAYVVIVTNAYGSATSGIANLVVGRPPQRLAVNFASGQGVHLQSSGTPNFPYVLQSATNLAPPVSWQPVVTNLADTGGNWAFTDTNTSQYPARFYRMSVP